MDQNAHILREGTGTSGVIESARTAVGRLDDHDIPHLIIGGLAVQEHGYPRVTIDVDIVVPDVLDAVELLTADLSGPFVRVPGVADRIEDKRNGVCIDLLLRLPLTDEADQGAQAGAHQEGQGGFGHERNEFLPQIARRREESGSG